MRARATHTYAPPPRLAHRSKKMTLAWALDHSPRPIVDRFSLVRACECDRRRPYKTTAHAVGHTKQPVSVAQRRGAHGGCLALSTCFGLARIKSGDARRKCAAARGAEHGKKWCCALCGRAYDSRLGNALGGAVRVEYVCVERNKQRRLLPARGPWTASHVWRMSRRAIRIWTPV